MNFDWLVYYVECLNVPLTNCDPQKGIILCINFGDTHQFIGQCLIPLDPWSVMHEWMYTCVAGDQAILAVLSTSFTFILRHLLSKTQTKNKLYKSLNLKVVYKPSEIRHQLLNNFYLEAPKQYPNKTILIQKDQ